MGMGSSEKWLLGNGGLLSPPDCVHWFGPTNSDKKHYIMWTNLCMYALMMLNKLYPYVVYLFLCKKIKSD